MKFLMVILPAIAIALIYMAYKRDSDIKKLIISFVLLWAVITLALLGMVMLSLKILFFTHMLAIFIAYGGLVYYILRNKFIWLALVAPLGTITLYLILVWIGNEHLPSV